MSGQMQIVVMVIHMGYANYLRGTTWTSDFNRADKFPTIGAATLAGKMAEKFMAPKIRRSYSVNELTGPYAV